MLCPACHAMPFQAAKQEIKRITLHAIIIDSSGSVVWFRCMRSAHIAQNVQKHFDNVRFIHLFSFQNIHEEKGGRRRRRGREEVATNDRQRNISK